MAFAIGWFVWKTGTDPDVSWLATHGPAQWIIYPAPADMLTRQLVRLDTEFRREFQLREVPASAVLRYRAFRDADVRVNGEEIVPAQEGQDWKQERRVEVARLLKIGANTIDVRVANDRGRPAVWLQLELRDGSMVSDERWDSSWAGAVWRAAVRADAPLSVSGLDPDRHVPAPVVAIAIEWRRLLFFGLVSAAAAIGIARLRRKKPGWICWDADSPWPLRVASILMALAWVALFVNDAPSLPLSYGFDAPAHLDYVRYILERHAVPLADEGWQMFQPPLYYLTTALAFAVARASPSDPAAPWILRSVGLAIGLVQLALVAACLRRVFPREPRRQVLGLVVGGFVPCMLYLYQYPANEPLAAALSTGALVLALGLASGELPRVSRHVLLGFVLGLALLAKFSTILLLPVVIGALAIRAATGERRWRFRRWTAIGAALATAVITCGWYFARVWWRFGTPFVGGWDSKRGMGWWQDPSYRTVADYARFGRALAEPLFAGFHGFWDGLYVTCWGDGLFSGMAGSTSVVPPWWSPNLMSAACALSLLIALAVVAGALRSLVAWIAHPGAVLGMLLGLAFLALAAVVWMSVKVPTVAADKATYGLMALAPLCVFAARALDSPALGRPWMKVAVATLAGTWALTSYSTYWIDRSSVRSDLVRGVDLLATGQSQEGIRLLYDRHLRDPDNWSPRLLLAEVMLSAEAPREEIARQLEPDRVQPEIADRLFLLSLLAERDGARERALAHARRAVELRPDDRDYRVRLAGLLAAAGAPAPAIEAWREVLRISPQHEEAHQRLAGLYDSIGMVDRAAIHRAYATRLAEAAARERR